MSKGAFNRVLNKVSTLDRARLEKLLNNAVRRSASGCETSSLVADVIRFHCARKGLKISGRNGNLEIWGGESHAFNYVLDKVVTFGRARLEAVLNNAVRRSASGCETSSLVADVIRFHCARKGLKISGRNGNLEIWGGENE